MRRTTITISAALVLLAFAPASAVARHHSRRHHSRARHTRIERFGRDATTSTSAENAGTVQSFSGGRLTITLVDGSTVSGRVTSDTELECTAPEQSQTMHEEGDGGSGDRSGSGEDQVRGPDDQRFGKDQGDAAEQSEDRAEDQDEHEAVEENENEAENNCSAAELTHGRAVREAELRISSGGGVWEKVELGS